jgi:hypothetical protein
VLILSSCEKEYLLENAEVQDCQIEQCSYTSALINQIAEDSSFVRIFQLSTIDNYVLQSYMENRLDTTDIWLLFDELGVDYSSPALTIQHDKISFEVYDDLIDFVENKYADSLMVQYFEEIEQNWGTFYHDNSSILNELDHQYLGSALSQAFEMLLNNHQQVFSERIVFRTNECEECYHEHETCMSDTHMNAGGAFGSVALGGAVSGFIGGGPAGAGGGFILGLAGGAVAGAFTWGIGYYQCQRDLNNCLTNNGCEQLGGGWDGSGGCLECVIKT